MDGLFHGKPYEQMDDLGGNTTIFGNTHMDLWILRYFECALSRIVRSWCSQWQ